MEESFCALMNQLVDQGVAYSILIIFLYGTYRIGWWVAKRLLDPATKDSEGGILVQQAAAHREFLDRLEKRDEAQQILCGTHAHLLDVLGRQAATTRFDRAIVDMTTAQLLRMSVRPDTPPDEVYRIEQEIKRILANMNHRHMAIVEHGQPEA